MTDFSKMTRAEMRAHLRSTDPQPAHWLKRANRALEARLEANRVANGWPEIRESVSLPAVEREPIRPVERPSVSDGFGGVALP